MTRDVVFKIDNPINNPPNKAPTQFWQLQVNLDQDPSRIDSPSQENMAEESSTEKDQEAETPAVEDLGVEDQPSDNAFSATKRLLDSSASCPNTFSRRISALWSDLGVMPPGINGHHSTDHNFHAGGT